MIPWIKSEDIISYLESNEIYEFFFSQIKAGEDETYSEMYQMGVITKNALYLILFSLYSLILAALFYVFDEAVLLYFLVLLIGLGVVILKYYYHKQPESIFESHFNKKFREIKAWVNGDQNR